MSRDVDRLASELVALHTAEVRLTVWEHRIRRRAERAEQSTAAATVRALGAAADSLQATREKIEATRERLFDAIDRMD